MALLIECPECRKLSNPKTRICKGELVICPECKTNYTLKAQRCPECKELKPKIEERVKTPCRLNLAKHLGRVWWIEYYDHEQRLRRERIGPNKAAAEQKLREVLSARTEGRYIKKCPDSRTKFKDLSAWYLELPEVKMKKSYKRDRELVAHLLPHFGDKLLKDINPELVESYKEKRLSEPSGRTPTKLTAPATVNREVACLKAIFNKAIANDKAERSPFQGKKVKMLVHPVLA